MKSAMKDAEARKPSRSLEGKNLKISLSVSTWFWGPEGVSGESGVRGDAPTERESQVVCVDEEEGEENGADSFEVENGDSGHVGSAEDEIVVEVDFGDLEELVSDRVVVEIELLVVFQLNSPAFAL